MVFGMWHTHTHTSLCCLNLASICFGLYLHCFRVWIDKKQMEWELRSRHKSRCAWTDFGVNWLPDWPRDATALKIVHKMWLALIELAMKNICQFVESFESAENCARIERCQLIANWLMPKSCNGSWPNRIRNGSRATSSGSTWGDLDSLWPAQTYLFTATAPVSIAATLYKIYVFRLVPELLTTNLSGICLKAKKWAYAPICSR